MPSSTRARGHGARAKSMVHAARGGVHAAQPRCARRKLVDFGVCAGSFAARARGPPTPSVQVIECACDFGVRTVGSFVCTTVGPRAPRNSGRRRGFGGRGGAGPRCVGRAWWRQFEGRTQGGSFLATRCVALPTGGHVSSNTLPAVGRSPASLLPERAPSRCACASRTVLRGKPRRSARLRESSSRGRGGRRPGGCLPRASQADLGAARPPCDRPRLFGARAPAHDRGERGRRRAQRRARGS